MRRNEICNVSSRKIYQNVWVISVDYSDEMGMGMDLVTDLVDPFLKPSITSFPSTTFATRFSTATSSGREYVRVNDLERIQ